MDDERVSGSSSEHGREDKPSRPQSYTEIFERLCPFYMAIGMSRAEFWDGDVDAARDYRKAHEMRRDMENQAAWLQGMYFYDAICCAAPIIRAFSKARRPLPYPQEPYDLNTHVSEMRQEAKEAKQYQKNRAKVESFAEAFNQRFKGKEKPPTALAEGGKGASS